MILIISSNSNSTVHKILDWLEYFGANYIIIKKYDIIDILNINTNSFVIKVNGKIINSKEITGYYFANGDLNIVQPNFSQILDHDVNTTNIVSKYINTHYKSEMECYKNFIYSILNSIENIFCTNLLLDINKLEVIKIASKLGLNTPKWAISSELTYVHEEFSEKTELITKVAGRSFNLNIRNSYKCYTDIITFKENNIFAPSFLQKNILKKYEIRTFYLDGKFYSMAIFSQNDTNTKIDYRKYNFQQPNRCVPYKLPITLEKKLKRLMKILNLQSGSLDIIKSIDGSYYFLEVNPFGQFGNLSLICNYNLEMKIAKKLVGYGN
jgi:ATP-GRASP peptide maturase of grasp-with-spasm system